MDAKCTEKLINEAIKLELNMNKIYTLFHDIFPEDSDFWKKIAAEELVHAEAIIRIKPFFVLDEVTLSDLINSSLKSMQNENEKILKTIDEFKNNPDRHKALEVAFEIENGASEIHYQSYLDNIDDSKLSKIFKTLNGNDKDHALRIKEYMGKLLNC